MSESSLSDYEGDEFSPAPAPLFCCRKIKFTAPRILMNFKLPPNHLQTLSHPPANHITQVPQPAHPNNALRHSLPVRVNKVLFSHRGKSPFPDSFDIPLNHEAYDTAIASIVQTNSPVGTISSNTRWVALLNIPGSPAVQISKHKVHSAQKKELLKEERIPISYTYGDCPKHPVMEYQVHWYAFVNPATEPNAEDPASIASVTQPASICQSQTAEPPAPEALFEPQDDDEDSDNTIDDELHSDKTTNTPLKNLSTPLKNTPPDLKNTTTLLGTTAMGITFEALRERVKDGHGVPCDGCARIRRNCSRRFLPGGPPACEVCLKKDQACTWDTVGSGNREGRRKGY